MQLTEVQIIVAIVVSLTGAVAGLGSLGVVIYKAIAEAREKRNAAKAAEEQRQADEDARERELEAAAAANGTTLKDVESQVTERLLTRLNAEMERLSRRVESQDVKSEEQDKAMDGMGSKIRSLERLRARDHGTMVEMYHHIVQTEALVPNPPGPPPRRWNFSPETPFSETA